MVRNLDGVNYSFCKHNVVPSYLNVRKALIGDLNCVHLAVTL